MEIRAGTPRARPHRNDRMGVPGEGLRGMPCASEPEPLALPLSCIISPRLQMSSSTGQRRNVENPPMERDDLTQWLEMFQTPSPEEMALLTSLWSRFCFPVQTDPPPKSGVCLQAKEEGATMLSPNWRRDRNVSQGC
jgi:hypothetical protein